VYPFSAGPAIAAAIAVAAPGPTATATAAAAAQPAADASGLSINLFWVIVAAGNFLIFFLLIWWLGFGPISRIMAERKARIDQGLADAAAARKARQESQAEHEHILIQARREASEMIARAQKSAEELREADIAATKAELERLRLKAAADIVAERDRALADLRGQVADLALAAATRVVGESMTDARQRRLVEEFLSGDQNVNDGRPN
jgi:F-type H+-transporting ATPase subunit b